MNAIRQTQQLNKRELENATPPSASWHADYRDTAWVYVGGLPLDLSEGDVVTIFSQFGNPTHLNLIRDRDTGKRKGFGFLKYEDQRSCDLAVDNLTGTDVLGRLLRVDHTRYKKKDDEDEETYRIDRLEAEAEAGESDRNGKHASDTDESEDERRRRKRRRALKGEEEQGTRLAVKNEADEEDPMADYIANERKRDEKRPRRREDDRGKKHEHHHRRHRDEGDRNGDRERRRRRHRSRDRSDGEMTSKKKQTERRDHNQDLADEGRASSSRRRRDLSQDQSEDSEGERRSRPRRERSRSRDAEAAGRYSLEESSRRLPDRRYRDRND